MFLLAQLFPSWQTKMSSSVLRISRWASNLAHVTSFQPTDFATNNIIRLLWNSIQIWNDNRVWEARFAEVNSGAAVHQTLTVYNDVCAKQQRNAGKSNVSMHARKGRIYFNVVQNSAHKKVFNLPINNGWQALLSSHTQSQMIPCLMPAIKDWHKAMQRICT